MKAIAQILNNEYQPPALSRIAIMPFGQEGLDRGGGLPAAIGALNRI